MIKSILMNFGRVLIVLGFVLLAFEIFSILEILNSTKQIIINTSNMATALSTICSGAFLMGFSYLLDVLDGINANIYKSNANCEKDRNEEVD